MKIALVGLKNAGKTTLFNALTGQEAEVTSYTVPGNEPHIGIVPVEDEKVEALARLYRPKKTTLATVNFVDFPGLSPGDAASGLLSGENADWIRNADAFALVARNFPDDLMGEPAPLADVRLFVEELVIADLMVVENRLERIAWGRARGRRRSAAADREERLLEKLRASLEDGKTVREAGLSYEETKTIQSFHLLSEKPLLVVLNTSEARYGKNADLMETLGASFPVVEFAGQFEMELARLGEGDDATLFMEDLGIPESARARLTKAAYALLGRISFYTVGEDEVRAWTLRQGGSAVDAAGTIHSDLARGFIRAECFSTGDLFRAGSEKRIRESGLFRLEGKDYVVKPGDILSIRFSV